MGYDWCIGFIQIAAPALGVAGFDNGTVGFLAKLGCEFCNTRIVFIILKPQVLDNITYEDETGSAAHSKPSYLASIPVSPDFQ